MVAYRRVTHITFIIIGFITRTKLMLVRVALVSLSHGWAAIAIFARAGTLRQSASSRLGYLLGSEIRLFWLILVLGLILVLNAGIPPILSFFSRTIISSFRNNNGGLFYVIIFRSKSYRLLLQCIFVYMNFSYKTCYTFESKSFFPRKNYYSYNSYNQNGVSLVAFNILSFFN